MFPWLQLNLCLEYGHVSKISLENSKIYFTFVPEPAAGHDTQFEQPSIGPTHMNNQRTILVFDISTNIFVYISHCVKRILVLDPIIYIEMAMLFIFN